MLIAPGGMIGSHFLPCLSCPCCPLQCPSCPSHECCPLPCPFFNSLGNGGYDREGDRYGSSCREERTAAVRSGSLLDHVCLYASCFGFFLEGRLETVLQSSFSARGYAVEAIYATGGIYGEVLAVDCLRLTSMLAITTMRTSFFVKGDPEKRIPGDQAQQRSYRAKRIAEQPSPEYDHEDEYE